jgi:YidC/Oxa1 family membrane protein insertase
MYQLFYVVLYQPIFNFLVWLYNIIPGQDIGVAIIIITILIRLALYPMTSKSIEAQRSLQGLQPKMNEIKAKYKDDKQKQTQAIMELYKHNKVNPFGSCLPLLIQLPILIALYKVLQDGLISTDLSSNLYSFVSNPGQLNPLSFGFIDMAKPNIYLAIMAGAAQFWQAKTMIRRQAPKEAGPAAKDENMMAMMNKQMLYFMPALTVFIGLSLPAGVTLYWFFSTLLMSIQQIVIAKKNPEAKKEDGVIEGKIVSENKEAKK